MRLRTVLYLLGLLTMMFSVSMLPPMAIGWWYGDGETAPFGVAFGLMLVIGFVFWVVTRGRRPEIRGSDGFLVVTLFWVALSLLGALPLMLSDRPHMELVDAVFEAVSGLTTTGGTVLASVENLPHSINFYRMQLQFMGGMGVVVLAVALLPMLGIGGMQLYRAETPGPMKEDKLTPRITETAKSLWVVYVGVNAACAVAFWIAGMDPFDAFMLEPRLLQIVLAALLFVGMVVLVNVAAFGGSGDVGRWAAISTIWIAIPVCTMGFVFLALTGAPTEMPDIEKVSA